ncbi:T9SS type A sorting domain-containing protein, partial [Myroides marinus]|uniref:MBG domain-containing protein n=3 Tax=Myroides marinus TaxID=703342 RepID=UPI0025779F03
VPVDFTEIEYTYKDKEGKVLTGAPTEAGEYTVEAIVKGGKNYEDKKFNTTVTIAKAVIPNGTLESKTVTYDGNPQGVTVEGIPSDFEVTYVYSKDGQPIVGAPTEAGEYTVEAIVKGGANYEDKKFEAKVTIAKAVIPNGTLESKTVTYDGTPQGVTVEGVPSDFEVTYVYSKDGNPIQGAPTEAGDYTVEAIVKGGTNYEDKKFNTTITIAKAAIPGGTLDGKTVTYDGTPQGVIVEGVPADFTEIEYTYKDKEGKVLTGAPTDAGEYTVEAIVKGGTNYEDKKFTTTVTIAKAAILGGTLDGKTVTYDGTPQGVIVEGVPVDFTEIEYTYKDKEGKVLTELPTDAGEYTVEAIVKGGTNYEDKKFTTTVTISKAVIPNGKLESKTVTYDGTPQGVTVEGVPSDFEVTYVYSKDGNPIQGAPTEAGDYTVEAIVKGGKNYEDKKFEAKVTITKAAIPGGTLDGKTVTYDGTPQGVTVEGVPVDFTEIEYTYKDKEGKVLTEAPTDAGEYTVEAIVKGGKNYEDKKFEATVAISKAAIPGGTLDGKTVTYDGNPQGVTVEGVPSDFEVTYVYSKDGNPIQGAPTEAGEYTVEAIVKGGANYEDKKFNTTVTIAKAAIPGGTLDGKTVTYNGNPQGVTVEGVPSDFEVTYVYSKDGNPIQGAPTEAGEYTVEAIVKGGANYEDKKFNTTVTIAKAAIPGGTLDGKTVTYNGNPQGVTVEGVPSDFEVTYVYSKDGNPIQGAPTEAGEYTVEAIVKGGKNYEDKKFNTTVTIAKAAIPGGTLDGKTVTYDGTPQGVTVEGVPSDFEVTYVYSKDGNPIQGAPTEAGEYTVEAIIKGGANYEDKKFEAKVTISKAVIPNGTLEGKTVTYNGNPQEVKVEGVPADLVVEYTYKDKEGKTLTGAPTEAGEYTVEAIVKGGTNYEDKKFEAKVTISKAVIPNGTLEGKTVTYNGNPQEVKVEGVPADLVVEYTYKDKEGKTLTGAPTEAGDYIVEAIVKGGANYEDKKFEAKVTISKAVIPNGTLEGKTVTYNGNPQGVTVEGIPSDFEVTYVYSKDGQPIVGAPTEAGEYTVEAIVKGGKNYEDKKFTTTVKIAKAAISGVTFNGKETTYNGLTQRIEIVGELPKEASVSYESNEGVNAGEYLAKAIIKGGKNYEDLVLTTTLKINKANITGVSFIDKVVAYNKAEQFIEITGALPTGVTVVYEKAKQTEVGIYEAVARIVGGTNYNDLRLTARFEIKEDRTPSKDAEIFELVINGVVYKKPGQVIEHMLRPTPYEDITDVDVVSFTDYSSLNVPEAFTVDTRDPKVYYKDITVTSEDGKTSKTYTLKLIKPIEDRLIILQKFQNTLLINNNPSTNGGYAFVSYQWFRNGVVVSTKQSYSVGQAGVDKLNPNDYYYLIVKTTTGEEIYSTRIDIYEEQSKEIKLYPNPVSSSDMTTNIMVDYSAAQFEKGRVEILTPDGRFIYRQELTIGENRVVIPTQLSAGIYLAVVDINGKKQTIRFSVK